MTTLHESQLFITKDGYCADQSDIGWKPGRIADSLITVKTERTVRGLDTEGTRVFQLISQDETAAIYHRRGMGPLVTLTLFND